MNLALLIKRLGKVATALTSPRQAVALLRHGVLAGNEHCSVLTSDIRSVVDIGANRGQFALAVRRRLPNTLIICFEPLAGPAAVFQSLFAHDALTHLHICAVGACHEQRQMHVSARDDCSSLLSPSEAQWANYPGTETVMLKEVEVVPLDNKILPGSFPVPSMLKIDVQGGEYETLLGCATLLSGFKYVYCECAFVELYHSQRLAGEIVAWLFARGFDLIGVRNVDLDRQNRPLQADFLFQARVTVS